MFYQNYISISDQKVMALKSKKRLEKTLKRTLDPIILTSTKLAISWWGKMWNMNLERYAEYSNRIGRGKTYVKNGLVIDLQIEESKVLAYVQGKRREPYQIFINIEPISTVIVDKIKQKCQGKLDTVEELLEGQFSKEIATIFMEQGAGIFPEPKEIKFFCTCPDYASCCKHISAVLYGIGSKVDINPLLFFTLRGINLEDFLKDVIISKTTNILSKGAKCKSNRIIANTNIEGLFDIDLD